MFYVEQEKAKEANNSSSFEENSEVTTGFNKEIIEHYPRQYIILYNHSLCREISRVETEHVTVTLEEVQCDFIYSTPTG